VTFSRLEPEPDAILTKAKPLRTCQGDVEFLERCCCHERKVEKEPSLGSGCEVALKLREIAICSHVANLNGPISTETVP
jgi:hypothetical protein